MKLLRDIYFARYFFRIAGGLILILLMGNFIPGLFMLGQVLLFLWLFATVIDFILLFVLRGAVLGERHLAERFSNGDPNPVKLKLLNQYRHTIYLEVIDELPFQFQIRDHRYEVRLGAGAAGQLDYQLTPVTRGEYHFGIINLYAASPLRLLARRFRGSAAETIAVYPSFMQMRKYTLLAISNRLSEVGIKKIRRVGHTMEFDQIRDYVRGDDRRTINWKATARRNSLMINHYRDERSQNVYSVINMGRTMKMPFGGMTLLDYAINTSLVISNIAIRKEDRAGIITFSKKVDDILPAGKHQQQMYKIQELLYRQQTQFEESGYEALYATVSQYLKQRSLIILYTNFDTLNGLRRQLKYLRQINRRHLLVTIFFADTDIRQLRNKPANSLYEVYRKTIAESHIFEQRQIVKELQQYGIFAVLTSPQQLTANTINQYLQLKARGFI